MQQESASRPPTPLLPTPLLLVLAVAGEVTGTVLLRLSEGATRPAYVLGVVVMYGLSIAVFGRVLDRGMALGVAYGLLTASGLVAATLLSVLVFADRLGPLTIAGIVVLGIGAVLLQTGRDRERSA